MRKAFKVLMAFPMLWSMSSVAWTGDCSFLGKDPLGRDPLAVGDRQLFYLPPGGQTWQLVNGSSIALGGQTVSFAFIIQETMARPRSGAVILKSGRTRAMDEPTPEPSSRRIQLERPIADSGIGAIDNGTCGLVPVFSSRDVAARSYDDYHDGNLRVAEPDQTTLKAFHYKYVGRNGRCRRTDDTREDSREPIDRRSNRSQFSFNPNIVKNGIGSEVASLATPSSAFASSERFADQRVGLQAYRAEPGLPTCVRFTLKVPARAAFVRINDLEGLKTQGVNNLRADEVSWTLSP
jgi:hypothetical protein